MGKCKFWKKCGLYDRASIVCNNTNGMYYGDCSRPAGCYREIEENLKLKKKTPEEIFSDNWRKTKAKLKKQ